MDTRVVIIGGGIAGLSATIALRHYGIESMVYEQADDLAKTQVGSGLSLGPNVTRAFKHLGILDEVIHLTSDVTGFEFKTKDGEHLATARPLRGEKTLGVLRPAVHSFLAEKAGADQVQL